jgi:Rod binding domain-containing protein
MRIPPVATSTRPKPTELREKVQEWVSQAFVGEMLKQARNSPFKSEVFSGGKAGDTYQQMYDQHVVQQVAPAMSGGLVDSLVRRLDRSVGANPSENRSAARTSPSRSVETELRKRYQVSQTDLRTESETRHDALDHPA